MRIRLAELCCCAAPGVPGRCQPRACPSLLAEGHEKAAVKILQIAAQPSVLCYRGIHQLAPYIIFTRPNGSMVRVRCHNNDQLYIRKDAPSQCQLPVGQAICPFDVRHYPSPPRHHRLRAMPVIPLGDSSTTAKRPATSPNHDLSLRTLASTVGDIREPCATAILGRWITTRRVGRSCP